RFHVANREDFRIAVDSKISAAGTSGGAVSFAWHLPDNYANDAFANAVQLDQAPYHELLGANVGATKQPGEPNHCGDPGGASVWYKWTPYFAGKAQAQILNGAQQCVAVYTGTGVGSLTAVGTYPFRDDDSNVWFDVTDPFRTYYIAVDGHLRTDF